MSRNPGAHPVSFIHLAELSLKAVQTSELSLIFTPIRGYPYNY